MVIDVETAGLDPMRHALLTVGVVALDPQRGPIDGFEISIHDPGEINEEALAYNGLNLASVRAQAVSPEEAVSRLEAFIRGYVPKEKVTLAGHNVAFDVGFLRRLYRLASADYDSVYSHRLVDLHSWYMLLALAGSLSKTSGSLSEIAVILGVESDGKRHTAYGDAMLTARCLYRILNLIRVGEATHSAGSAL